MTENLKNNHWKRSTVTAGIFMLLLGVVLPAAAQPVIIFGPQKFVREEGKPAATRTTFHVPADVNNCRLEINSNSTSPLAANNVSVMVNGVEMADSNTLKSGDSSPAEVQLLDTNILLVTLKGKPGDSVTVKIFGEQAEEDPQPQPLFPPD